MRWVSAVGRANQFVEEANHIRKLDGIFWHYPDLLDTFKRGGWDVVADMFETCFLAIDEIGGGHDPSRIGVDKLCQILTRREHRWTIVTTNYPQAAWEETFDRRVASRLFRNATQLDLSDVPDFATL